MVQEETIEDVLNLLNRNWCYHCRLDNGFEFDNGDVERGGTMAVKAALGHFGLNIKIEAFRKWGVSKENIKTKYLDAKWEAIGGIYESNNSVYFTYKGGEGNKLKGKTRDVFLVDFKKRKFSNGAFEHTKKDGSIVTGSVKLFK